MRRDRRLRKIILTALFLALGFVLPLFTGQIPQIGAMLLPMHIPVFLCAFICGPLYSVPMAMILPLLRSFLFGRPNFYPEAIAIALELATYALIAGFFYRAKKKPGIAGLYAVLVFAMIVGRCVRGMVQLLLLQGIGISFPFSAFFFGIVLYGLPGIILQLILIPMLLALLNKKEYYRNERTA